MSYFSSVTIKEVVIKILEILKNIQRPSWWDTSSNRLRATAVLESGSTTAVTGTLTGVTTVATVTNLNGYSSNLGIIYGGYNSWYTGCRSRIA